LDPDSETRAVIVVAANKPAISPFRPHIFATGAPGQMQRAFVWYAPLRGVGRTAGGEPPLSTTLALAVPPDSTTCAATPAAVGHG
jgi:hypothetical protein